MHLNRRTAIKGVVGGALVAGPFAGFANAAALSRTGALAGAAVGTLVPVADARDSVVRLFLPEGFAYRSFHDTEWPVVLDDGSGCRAATTAWARSRRRGQHDPGAQPRGEDDRTAFGPGKSPTTRRRAAAPRRSR